MLVVTVLMTEAPVRVRIFGSVDKDSISLLIRREGELPVGHGAETVICECIPSPLAIHLLKTFGFNDQFQVRVIVGSGEVAFKVLRE